MIPERRTIEVDGRQVRCLVGGGGPPLVWLHSLGGDVEWGEAHDRLAGRFTVHLPAHPGFAESTGSEQMLAISASLLRPDGWWTDRLRAAHDPSRLPTLRGLQPSLRGK